MAQYRSKVSAKAEEFRKRQEDRFLRETERMEAEVREAAPIFSEPHSMEEYHARMALLRAELRASRDESDGYYSVRGRRGDAHRNRDASLRNKTDATKRQIESLEGQIDRLRLWYGQQHQ